MPIKRTLMAAGLSYLLICFSAFGAEPRFDGHFWRQSDPSTRRFFVYSFMCGVIQGQDRVASRLLIKSDRGDFRPECHQAVAKNANALETELTRLDRDQFMTALDAFYGPEKNRDLELKWAVLVVMQQLQGRPPGDLEDFIEALRQQAP